jgi:hypothetical protein
MKKYLTGLLAFLYLSTSMGASIHLHYCMGKLISWGLINHESRNCDYCGMPKNTADWTSFSSSKHCCKDVHQEIKAGSDQKLIRVEFQFVKKTAKATLSFAAFHSSSFTSGLLTIPTTHVPPILHGQPVFLLNRRLLI